VISADEGKIIESKTVKKDFIELLKTYARKAIDEWNPLESDFTIIRSTTDISYTHPISPELFDKVQELGLNIRREGNEIIITIPVYTISYDSQWMESYYRDRKIIVIAPYLDEKEKKQLEEYASEATSEAKRLEEELTLTEEEYMRLEEGLKELLAAYKSRYTSHHPDVIRLEKKVRETENGHSMVTVANSVKVSTSPHSCPGSVSLTASWSGRLSTAESPAPCPVM